MSFKHGVYTGEKATAIVAPAPTDAGIPIVFGTAPINLATNGYKNVTNIPILCETYAGAVEALGYSDDWDKYTLCEFIYSHFALFAMCPVIFINVLDPDKHKAAVSDKSVNLSAGTITLQDTGILLDTLTVKTSQAGENLKKNIDYTAAFNGDKVVISRIASGSISSDTATIIVGYTKLDPSLVTPADVIGGVDASTGAYTGLEVLNQVFPKLRLIPGQICAPYWSTKPSVAAVMESKAASINGVFKAISLVDIPTDEVKKYSDAPAWKNNNNYMYSRQICCWPKVKLDDKVFHLSTQLAGRICSTDHDNDDVPYESPSNKSLQMNGLVLKDGTEVVLGLEEANYLNGQGIVTALNFIGGWKLWGNRTAAYPANTDPKDAFISIRRMFDWNSNTFIQTYWQKVDNPTNRVLVETVVDSENLRLNGLASQHYLLGGRIEFTSAENPITDLENGIIRFHTYLTPPTPAEEISDTIEYDTGYLPTLFGSK